METNFRANVGPGHIQKIEILDTEVERLVNGVRTNVPGKVYMFYFKLGKGSGSTSSPGVFAAFPRQHADLIEDYKNLPTETIDGVVTITGDAIKKAQCPEHLQKYLNKETGAFKHDVEMGGDGYVYGSYGMYLWAHGTWGAFDPKEGTQAFACATIPIGDGVQEFYRMKKGEIRKDKNDVPIKQTTAKIAVIVDYNPLEKAFGNDDGLSPEAAVRGEMDEQIRNRLWRLVELPKTFEDIVKEQKDSGAAEASQQG